MPGIYGQAAIVPDRSVVGNILKEYLDVLFTPANNKNKKEEWNRDMDRLEEEVVYVVKNNKNVFILRT